MQIPCENSLAAGWKAAEQKENQYQNEFSLFSYLENILNLRPLKSN